MLDLLWRTSFRYKLRPQQVTGDTAYGTTENIAAVERMGVRAYVPLTSSAVSRSEAGLLVDGLLMDIKATVTPKIKSEMIHQLLGYTLLDYADDYRIRHVGIYMARQAYYVRWRLSELLNALGCEKSLKELRTLFSHLIC